MDYFVKNALSFIGGLTGSMLITQGNPWAGLAVYLVIVGFILCDYLTPKN